MAQHLESSSYTPPVSPINSDDDERDTLSVAGLLVSLMLPGPLFLLFVVPVIQNLVLCVLLLNSIPSRERRGSRTWVAVLLVLEGLVFDRSISW